MASNKMTKRPEDQQLTRARAEAAVQQVNALIPKFRMVLPPHVQPERFARICISALTQDPKLLSCTPKSILEACLTAAQLGLEPNKNIGEGYFIPFWNGKEGVSQCQWQTGYKGYLALARNSGEVACIDAQVVYEDDVFEYEYGLDQKLRHIPALGQRDDEKITHAWAMVKYKDGSFGFKVLTRAQIEKRRGVSKMSQTGAWKEWYPEMCIKTAIRALSNFLPKSVQKAVAIDNAYDQGRTANLDPDHDGDLLLGEEFSSEEEASQTIDVPSESQTRLDSFAPESKPDQPEKGAKA